MTAAKTRGKWYHFIALRTSQTHPENCDARHAAWHCHRSTRFLYLWRAKAWDRHCSHACRHLALDRILLATMCRSFSKKMIRLPRLNGPILQCLQGVLSVHPLTRQKCSSYVRFSATIYFLPDVKRLRHCSLCYPRLSAEIDYLVPIAWLPSVTCG